MAAWKPSASSLAGQVTAFFSKNPDTELTLIDIVENFGADNTDSARSLLSDAVQHIWVMREKTTYGWVYKRGPSCPVVLPSTPNADVSAPVAAATAAGSRKTRLDLDAIPMESGIPYERNYGGAPKEDWPKFLLRMVRGQSCVLPAKKRNTVQRAYKALNAELKGEWACGALEAKVYFRLWRLEDEKSLTARIQQELTT